MVEEDPGLERFNASLKETMKKSLCERAQGMFRLVHCQLDLLRKCNTPRQILSTLETLPSTLYDVYERILENTPDQNKQYLRRALGWLMFCNQEMNVVQLAEAMIVEPGLKRLDEWDRLGDVQDLIAFEENRWRDEQVGINPTRDNIALRDFCKAVEFICGSFIKLRKVQRQVEPKFSTFKCVLAHYSVKEFFLSERLANKNNLGQFFFPKDEGIRFILDASLTYLQLVQFDESKADTKVIVAESSLTFHGGSTITRIDGKGFPLYEQASLWPVYASLSADYEMFALRRITTLLNPVAGQFMAWRMHVLLAWSRDKYPDVVLKRNYMDFQKEISPLYLMSAFGLPIITRDLISKSAPISSPDNYTLHIAARNDRAEVLRVLVDEYKVDILIPGPDLMLPIHYAAASQGNGKRSSDNTPKALRFLIDRMQDVDVTVKAIDNANYFTALRTAVTEMDANYHAAKMLLEAGANPNFEDSSGIPIIHDMSEEDHYKLFLEYGADIDAQDREGNTALGKQIRRCLDSGLDSSFYGMMALYGLGASLDTKHYRISKLEYYLSMVRCSKVPQMTCEAENAIFLLLEAGVNFNQPLATPRVLARGETLWTYSIRYRFPNLIRKMLELGADIQRKIIRKEKPQAANERYMTWDIHRIFMDISKLSVLVSPMEYILQFGNKEILEILFSQNAKFEIADDQWCQYTRPRYYGVILLILEVLKSKPDVKAMSDLLALSLTHFFAEKSEKATWDIKYPRGFLRYNTMVFEDDTEIHKTPVQVISMIVELGGTFENAESKLQRIRPTNMSLFDENITSLEPLVKKQGYSLVPVYIKANAEESASASKVRYKLSKSTEKIEALL